MVHRPFYQTARLQKEVCIYSAKTKYMMQRRHLFNSNENCLPGARTKKSFLDSRFTYLSLPVFVTLDPPPSSLSSLRFNIVMNVRDI